MGNVNMIPTTIHGHTKKPAIIRKRDSRGFTLMELLVVIAIIAVLVAIAIPTLSNFLEKSREAADLANVRSAYAQVSAEALLGDPGVTVTVELGQKHADWQSLDPVNIGGIIHYKDQGDTDNWKGVAKPGGVCVVSYDEKCGVVLTWSGDAAAKYPFNTAITDYFSLLYGTDFWKTGTLKNNYNFEFDSRCPNSGYVQALEDALKKMDNSLLQQPNCTWSFLGSGRDGQEKNRYLFWTSLNTDAVGVGKQIPVLIQTGDGKYYVSQTTTGQRKGKTYITVSESIPNQTGYQQILNSGTQYTTLEEAYNAYLVALADPRYDGVRSAQPN